MNDLKNCMCGCIYAEKVCPNCNKITDKDRIEELEAELYAMTEDRNIVLETSQQQFIHTVELEAKLAKAIDFVAEVGGGFKFGESLVDWANLHVLKARTLLAKLKEETDE